MHEHVDDRQVEFPSRTMSDLKEPLILEESLELIHH